MTYKQVIEAVNEFFADQSRPAEVTLEGLEAIRDACAMLIEEIETDLDNKEDDDECE